MNTSKGAKGCSVLNLSSAPRAIEKLEDTWTLDPDHLLQKSWPVFLKSSTRSLHLLWRNNRLAVMVLIISTQTLGNTRTSHMSFYFKFPTSRAALSSPLSASPSSIFFSSSIFLSFLLLVALNIPGGGGWGLYFQISLHLRHSYTAGRHFPKRAQEWPNLCVSSLASSEVTGPSMCHLLSCLQLSAWDCPHPTRLPASDSPWTILLCEQDIKSIEHCL